MSKGKNFIAKIFFAMTVLAFVIAFSHEAGAAKNLGVVTGSVSTMRGVWINNDGVRFFKNDRKTEAYSRFAESLGEIPFSPGVHFNLATTYLANKEFEKALQEYGETIKLTEPIAGKKLSSDATTLRFAALFNSAVVATELKQIDKALDFYQSCLELVPNSVEVKTNIELLVQSQSGGGDGKDDKDQKDKDQSKDQKGKDQKKDGKPDQNKDQKKDGQGQPPKDQKPQPQQGQPKPFKSEELSQQDVNRIMEEIKRQEEQVRVKFQNDKVRDVPLDKDW